jgi:DNA-directed RNA polymerase specialized sigma24 family protein
VKRNSGNLTAYERDERRREIELGLAVLATVRQRGETLNTVELAEICGCSSTTIENIERRAMEKLRKAARRIER